MQPTKQSSPFRRSLRWTAVFFGVAGSLTAVHAEDAPTPSRAFASAKQWTLDQCLDHARQNHPVLKAARTRLDSSRSSLGAAEASRLLRADLFAGYDRLSGSTPQKRTYLGNSLDDFQAGVEINQPLYTGGRLSAEKDIADLAARIAQEDLWDAERRVLFDVEASYYRLLYAQKILIARTRLLERLRSHLDYSTHLNQRTGIPRKEALLRIESQFDNSRQEMEKAATHVETARRALIAAMGFDGPAITMTLEISDLGDEAVLPMTAHGTETHPATARARWITALYGKEAERTGSALYPSLDMRGVWRYEGSPEMGQDEWYAGLRARWNLFDASANRGRSKAARLWAQASQSAEEDVFRRIALEKESARLDYESSVRRVGDARSALEKAQKSFELTNSRYRDGLVGSYEWLDSYRFLVSAQESREQVLLDLRLSAARTTLWSGGRP